MMNKTLLALVLSSLATLSWAEECARPERPSVPNGAESNMEQMVAGQKAVKAYVAEGNTFTACLEAAEKSAASDVNKDDENAVAEMEAANAERIKMHNEVVDEMNEVATEWKDSMTAFKAKSSDG